MPGDERYGKGPRIAAGTGAANRCQQGLFPDMGVKGRACLVQPHSRAPITPQAPGTIPRGDVGKSISCSVLSLLYDPTLTSIHDY